MAIYELMGGAPGTGDRMVLICKKCLVPAESAKSNKLLKVCSKCGMPLAEWSTEAERDREIAEFEEKFKAGSITPR
jgi:hypothetical protein